MEKIFIKLTIIALLALPTMAMGQDEGEDATKSKFETNVYSDFVNQYIWRGQDLGNVSIQPTLGIEYKGLSLTAWGSVGLESKDTKEFDLTLAYTIAGLNMGVTDYWFSAGQDPEGRYFRYSAHSTNHVFEGNIGYDFGCVNLQCYTNFGGNDGTNEDGERAYSTYIEISAPFNFATAEWTATAGAVPHATSYYGTTELAVTNLSLRATKEIKINDAFKIPLFGQITGNPCSEKAYFVFGLTLQP